MSLKPLLLMAALGGLTWVGLTVSGLVGGSPPSVKAKPAAAQAAADAETPSLVITATDEVGEANLAAARGETPFELREQSTAGALPEIRPDSVAGLAAPDEPLPGEFPDDPPPADEALPMPAAPLRAGPVGVLTVLERLGGETGVSCEHISVPEEPGAPYELRGRGEAGDVVAFLAALERQPGLGGPVFLRVWSEDERGLRFRARWDVPAPGTGTGGR